MADLKELLDALENAGYFYAKGTFSTRQVDAARQAIEDRFRELTAQRDSALTDVEAAAYEIIRLRAQVASLEAQVLTPEELDDLDSALGDSLWHIEKRSDDLDDDDIAYVERCTALREKLVAASSRLSGKQDG